MPAEEVLANLIPYLIGHIDRITRKAPEQFALQFLSFGPALILGDPLFDVVIV